MSGATDRDVSPPNGFHGTFASLRVRNFRLFITGQLISTTGTWMQIVGGQWLVLQLSHSGTMLGLDASLQFLPMLLAGAWGGVIADRYDNRRTQIVTQAAYAILAMGFFALVATGVIRLWMVFGLSFLTGCVSAVDFPTRQSFYLEMVGPTDLTNAMSLNTATFTGTRIVGPAVAGLLIRAAGGDTAPMFLINALSYVAVIVALLAMRTAELHRRERVPRAKGQIREGIRYVWRTRDLRLPMLVMLFVFLFAYNFQVLMPLFAVRSFGGDSGTYGVMLSIVGVGSLAAALFMASRAKTPDPRRLSVFAVALGVVLIALAGAPALPAALIVLLFLGAAAISFAITGNSTLQLTSAPEMRGRVMSLYSVIFLGSTPIGGPIAGWVGQHLGPRVALAAGGAIAIVTGVAALAALGALGARRVRRARRTRPSAGAGGTTAPSEYDTAVRRREREGTREQVGDRAGTAGGPAVLGPVEQGAGTDRGRREGGAREGG
jgi:MFS family permease